MSVIIIPATDQASSDFPKSDVSNIVLSLFCLNSYLRRLQEGEVEDENKPLKLPGVLSTMTGTVMYPDEESAKWDVDGRHKFPLSIEVNLH